MAGRSDGAKAALCTQYRVHSTEYLGRRTLRIAQRRNRKYTDSVVVCPVDAFREGEQMLYIDPEICICCDQCVPECPVEAIFAEDDVPADQREFIQLNAEMARSCPPIFERREPLAGRHFD